VYYKRGTYIYDCANSIRCTHMSAFIDDTSSIGGIVTRSDDVSMATAPTSPTLRAWLNAGHEAGQIGHHKSPLDVRHNNRFVSPAIPNSRPQKDHIPLAITHIRRRWTYQERQAHYWTEEMVRKHTRPETLQRASKLCLAGCVS